jgi:hypothetical protein
MPASMMAGSIMIFIFFDFAGSRNQTSRPLSSPPGHDGRILTLPLGAPVSDPASIENPPETRRIGDRCSAIAAKTGAVSRCARTRPRCQLEIADARFLELTKE